MPQFRYTPSGIGRRGSGLRNRTRTGRSTYSIKGKSRNRDVYGEYVSGVQKFPDVIAGHTMRIHKPLASPSSAK